MEEDEAAPRTETEDVGESTAPQEDPSKVSEAGPSAAGWGRLKLFDKVLQKSIEKFIDTASAKQFAHKFRPLYKKNPKMVARIHEQFIEELRKTIQDDINRMIEEGRIESKLQELDKLEREAKNNPEPAWRPTGVPEEDVCSFLMPYYKKQEAFMRKELKKIQAENAALAQKVQAGRGSIAQAEQHIAAAVDEWKATVTDFESVASSLHTRNVLDL